MRSTYTLDFPCALLLLRALHSIVSTLQIGSAPPQPSALLTRYVWHVTKTLEREQMQEAARALCGSHDFATFGQPTAPGYSTVRFLERITVRSKGSCVLITVRGNAFLRQMVRGLVGTLTQVGQGKLNFRGGLRKGDELQDFFEAFAEMTTSLKDRQAKEIALLEAGIAAAKAAGASEESLEKIFTVRDEMKAALEV